jgi:hypothetical protein
MVFPDRPTGNAWQLIGQSFNQGAGIVDNLGTQQNALQALVERRTQAALEQKRLERKQAADDWELQQKQADEEKKQKFIEQTIKLSSKGVPNPDVTSKVPGPELASPSRDVAMQQPASIGGQAVKQYGYQPEPARGPDQTITAPGGYRPATEQDYKDAALQNGQMTVKDYTEPSNYDKAYGTMKGTIDADPTFSKSRATMYSVDDKIKIGEALAAAAAGRPLTEYQRQMLGFAKTRMEMGESRQEEQKDLQPAVIEKLTSLADKRDNVKNMAISFKDNFSGPGTWTQNKWGKLTGTNEDQVLWWQNYNSFVNQIRNDLFGVALSPMEKQSFESTISTESTDPALVRGYLAKQAKIIDDAVARKSKVYSAGKKVNQEQVSAALGVETPTEPIVTPPPKQTSPINDPRKKMAAIALKDPQATEKEKAQARKILGL